jgi:hypothetical protein
MGGKRIPLLFVETENVTISIGSSVLHLVVTLLVFL